MPAVRCSRGRHKASHSHEKRDSNHPKVTTINQTQLSVWITLSLSLGWKEHNDDRHAPFFYNQGQTNTNPWLSVCMRRIHHYSCTTRFRSLCFTFKYRTKSRAITKLVKHRRDQTQYKSSQSSNKRFNTAITIGTGISSHTTIELSSVLTESRLRVFATQK
jgi:hypothetical protein